jgi:mannose-6-phosphate isomerase-like protein (cupin superfamily)
METIEKLNAEHYYWGQACDGWHLVRTPELSIIQERMPPGTSEVPHYHQQSNQFFYVLTGTLSIEGVDGELTLNANQGVHIKAGEIHQVRNRSTHDTEFLVISNPPSHGDREIVP